MLTEERRLKIVEMVNQEGRVDAMKAASSFDVAVETIRRDLEVLQRRGYVRRVHGGAIALNRLAREFSVAERRGINRDSKARIAAAAAEYIPASGTIFVDAGTTTELLHSHLRDKPNLTVVTNSLILAAVIADSTTKVILISGRIRPVTLSAVGDLALSSMASLHADLAFIGTNGVDSKVGFTTPDSDEAEMKKTMISHSKESIVLADKSKFGKVFTTRFARLEEIVRVITDLSTSTENITEMGKHDIEMVFT